MMIKTTLLLIAAAGLTGCAVYPAAPYGTVYDPAPVYMAPSPVFIGGSVHYSSPRGHHRHGHRNGHGRPHGRHHR